MEYQKESNLKIGVSGAGKNYLKMPWSVEDTIENLEELKEMMQQKLIMTNYHGRGEKDAEEIAFDFDRAIQALKENQEYKQLGTLKKVRKAVEKQKPKKVSIEDVGYSQYRDVNLYACICPSCGLHIIEFDDDDVYESDSDNPAEMFRDCLVHHAYTGRNNYCDRCGQKLDWTEVEE